MGWGAGDGSVYRHRIVSTARSTRHVARHLRAARGKIDGANNLPAKEMFQEMMGCNCCGAELSTKTKELSDKLCKKGKIYTSSARRRRL